MRNSSLTGEETGEMTEFLKELIRTPSAENNGNGIYKLVKEYLEERGLEPAIQVLRNPYMANRDRSNLLLKLGNGKGPRIMLNGHLDTVMASSEWFHDPFEGVEEGGRIFGLGAADMKGGCAAMIGSVLALKDRLSEINGELLVTFVYGEEAPFSLGADTLLREYPLKDYDLIIIPEPSPVLAINDYCITHRKVHKASFPTPIIGAEGRILFEIELIGRSAHASHPSQGINALEDASMLIHKLTEFELYSSVKMGRGHYCVLNIEGGDQTFTVPSYCKIYINRQLTLGEDSRKVTNELRMIVKRMKIRSKVTIKKRFSPDPLLEYRPYMNEGGEMLDRFIEMLPKPERGKSCRFTTSSVGDFNIFATRTGVPTLVFGPGGGNIHSPNEYANRDEVVKTAEYLLNFMMEVFS